MSGTHGPEDLVHLIRPVRVFDLGRLQSRRIEPCILHGCVSHPRHPGIESAGGLGPYHTGCEEKDEDSIQEN